MHSTISCDEFLAIRLLFQLYPRQAHPCEFCSGWKEQVLILKSLPVQSINLTPTNPPTLQTKTSAAQCSFWRESLGFTHSHAGLMVVAQADVCYCMRQLVGTTRQ